MFWFLFGSASILLIVWGVIQDMKDRESQFVDSYFIKWKLQDEEGNTWWETYKEMSLSDFEVLYGNNVHELLEVKMKRMGVKRS